VDDAALHAVARAPGDRSGDQASAERKPRRNSKLHRAKHSETIAVVVSIDA
jgi:hypothetical protein